MGEISVRCLRVSLQFAVQNVVSQDGGDVFVAIVQAQTLRREAYQPVLHKDPER